MSQISTIYDNFNALVLAQLPNHSLLINPYDPGLNDDLTFEKAWGLAVGPAVKPEIELDCRLSIDRSFILTITRKLRVGDLQRNSDAVSSRRTTEKNLFEDQYLIIKKIDQDVTLTGACVNCKMESDDGLQFVRTDRVDLIMIRTLFTVRYFENIT